MELTRRGRAVAATGLALALVAPVLEAPALLWAGGGVAAVLLGAAAGFVARLGAARDDLAVEVTCEPDAPLADESARVRLAAERPAARLGLRVVVDRPAAASRGGPLAVVLDDHERASLEAPVHWPVAGSFALGPARVAATDPLGLFRAAFEAGEPATVRVRPREPDLHLGRGGTPVAGAFGQHRTLRDVGGGVVAATPRRYEPGVPVGRIDWKATARLDDVFVVDPEAERDRQTVLLVDHRARMAAGEPPETPLAFARHVALAVARSARLDGDPLGCVAVGDAGVTAAELPGVSPATYDAVEALLREIEPTAPARAGAAGHAASGAAGDRTAGAADDPTAANAHAHAAEPNAAAPDAAAGAGATAAATAGAGAGDGAGAAAAAESAGGAAGVAGTDPRGSDPFARKGPIDRGRDPRFGRRAASALASDDDGFARSLRPFFVDEPRYVERVDGSPLAAAARAYLPRLRGALWTVVVTDDAEREAVRETARIARRGSDRVLVVLAPRVLFESPELADVEEARARYRDFEAFRRELAGMDRVDALELAPGDRVEAVLSARGGQA